jgi:hypothetical protein
MKNYEQHKSNVFTYHYPSRECADSCYMRSLVCYLVTYVFSFISLLSFLSLLITSSVLR